LNDELTFLFLFLIMKIHPFFDHVWVVFCPGYRLQTFLDVAVEPVEVGQVLIVPESRVAIAKPGNIVCRMSIVEPQRG